MNNGLDPELADLLSGVDEDIATTKPQEAGVNGVPELTENGTAQTAEEPLQGHIDLPPGKEYLKKVIDGIGEEYTQRLIGQLDKAMNSPVKEDKTLFRQKLIPTYWNFISQLMMQITSQLPVEKKYCLRYGLVDITLLRSDIAQLIKSIPLDAEAGEYPFYYLDEWIKNVSTGSVKSSMIDEVSAKKSDTSAVQEKLDRKIDSKGAELRILKNKASERSLIEKSLLGQVNILVNHDLLSQFENIPDVYNVEQKSIMSKVMDDLRKLKNIDGAMAASLRDLQSIDMEIKELQSRSGGGEDIAVDSKVIINEYNSVKQMIKMCVGPRGNHFPILISDYAPISLDVINTKENVIKLVAEIEKRDSGVFVREFKGQKNRIIPFIILAPAYGEKGICWEPFDMRQRATSRGRIALPLFPRDPMLSILNAFADLRWQVAKEKASYRWMEEGLTGKYYDYFTTNKLKGNIKDEFIKDYILWITQEWNGMQKLHKDVRTVFWRYIAFPQEKKEELKNRGFFYNDLYKKDMNRAMSDGY